jgi:hypothetical protein
MTSDRDLQRADVARQIAAHRQWLAVATQGAVSFTAPQYAKWRAQLTVLQTEEKRLASLT